METTDYTIVIGTITYTDFPTYAEINLLRPDVIRELMIFFRMVGLCSIRQINLAIGNAEDDFRVQWMLRHAEVQDAIDESQSQPNMAYTEEVQRDILGDDAKPYTIKVSDIAIRLHKLSSHTAGKAITDLIHEQQGITEKPERKEKPMKQSVSTPKPKRSTVAEVTPEIEDHVQDIADKCPIRPDHDFQKVRKDKAYLEQLAEYFPHVTSSMIAQYLFHETVSMAVVGGVFRALGISKKEAKGIARPSASVIHERAAFVAWTGGDWEEYFEQNGPLEITTHKPAPEPPAPAEKPAPVEPPAPIEKPAPVEKPAPAAPDKPDFIAEIKLSAKNPEILRILNWLETEATAEILDYTVYRPTAK